MQQRRRDNNQKMMVGGPKGKGIMNEFCPKRTKISTLIRRQREKTIGRKRGPMKSSRSRKLKAGGRCMKTVSRRGHKGGTQDSIKTRIGG